MGIERYSIVFQSDLNNNQISTTVFNTVLGTISVLEPRCTCFYVMLIVQNSNLMLVPLTQEPTEQKPFTK